MYAINGTSFRAISSSDEATAEETVVETIPQALLDSIEAAESARIDNDTTLRSRADQAIAELRTFRDLASPTNAQTVAAVKLLCRVAISLIRITLRKLDGTD